MANAKKQKVQLILGRSLLTAESLTSELREQLLEELVRRRGALTDQELIQLAREVLDDFGPLYARVLTDADLAAWVAGTDDVVQQLPSFAAGLLAVSSPAIGQPPAPPESLLTAPGPGGSNEPTVRWPSVERAAGRLSERNIVTRAEFDALAATARDRAFTVARENSEEALGKILDTLAETVREGASLERFRDRLGEELESSFIGPWHNELVFRNAVQQSFQQAHQEMADNPIVRDVFPYEEYLPIRDGRVRENHLALEKLGLSGTGVYRRDDPFWAVFRPPWAHNCRCGTNLLDVEAAARKGVEEARRWERTGVPPANPEWRLDAIPFRPDPGFRRGAA